MSANHTQGRRVIEPCDPPRCDVCGGNKRTPTTMLSTAKERWCECNSRETPSTLNVARAKCHAHELLPASPDQTAGALALGAAFKLAQLGDYVAGEVRYIHAVVDRMMELGVELREVNEKRAIEHDAVAAYVAARDARELASENLRNATVADCFAAMENAKQRGAAELAAFDSLRKAVSASPPVLGLAQLLEMWKARYYELEFSAEPAFKLRDACLAMAHAREAYNAASVLSKAAARRASMGDKSVTDDPTEEARIAFANTTAARKALINARARFRRAIRNVRASAQGSPR